MTTTFEPPDLTDYAESSPAEPSVTDEGADPDAPYGRNPKTGEPYKRSKEWRDKLAAKLAEGRENQAAKRPPRLRARPKATGGTAQASKTASVDYRPTVMMLMQIPAMLCGIVGRTTGSEAWALDSATITLHAPGFAQAAHDTAMVDERLASILDKAMEVGPYGALIASGVPIVLQMLANHGKLAPNPAMGVLSKEELLAAVGVA